MPVVRLSNGQKLNFPEGMSQEEMHMAIQKQFGSKQSEIQPAMNKNMFEPLMMNPSNYGGKHAGLAAESMSAFAPFGAAARLLPKAAPALAKSVANYAGNIAQNAAIGGATNALEGENATKGAISGGALGALLPIAGKALKIGKSVVGDVKNILSHAKEKPILKEFESTANPEANALLEKLGGGARNKEEASKKLASHIMEGHAQRQAEAGQFFEHPLKQAGNERIYERVSPLISTRIDKEKEILGKLKGLNVGGLFDKFESNPTFNNAHQLQSELGAVLGDLKKNLNKSASDRDTIKNIKSIRDELKNDVMSFLKRRDSGSNENLAPMYKRGVDLYRENVEPYLSSRKLRDIVRGGTETPKNVEKIFQTPSNVINTRTGEIKKSPIHKILEDLPNEAKDLILFNKVGAYTHEGNAKNLSNALLEAKNKGYSSHFNPHVEEALSKVLEKSRLDKIAKKEIKESNKEALKRQRVAEQKLHYAKDIALKSALGGTAAGGAGYLIHKIFGGQ